MRQQMEQPLTESRREVADLREGHKKTSRVLDNIRRAVVGDESKAAEADPADAKIAHYQQQIDQYVQAAITAERQGRPIPLTVNAAIESLQGLIAQTEENKILRERLGKMESQVARVSDPGHNINMQSLLQHGQPGHQRAEHGLWLGRRVLGTSRQPNSRR